MQANSHYCEDYVFGCCITGTAEFVGQFCGIVCEPDYHAMAFLDLAAVMFSLLLIVCVYVMSVCVCVCVCVCQA